MLFAIHVPTSQKVSAWALNKRPEWQGKENDSFIAPVEEIDNWRELKAKGIHEVLVSLVKGYKRDDGTIVSTHFRIQTEAARATSESEAHKLAKETIYTWAWNDEITLINYQGKKLSDFKVKDIHLERGSGHMRADVLVEFADRHPTLGRGIAFEVQISPQTEKRTQERSYDRAFEDYSVVWIWDSDLKEDRSFEVTSQLECTRMFVSETEASVSSWLDRMRSAVSKEKESVKFDLRQSIIQETKELTSYVTNLRTSFENKLKEVQAQNSVIVANAYLQQENLKALVEKLKDQIRSTEDILADKASKIIEEKLGNTDSEKLRQIMLPKIEELILQKFEKEFESYPQMYKKYLAVSYQCASCETWAPLQVGVMYWVPGKTSSRECVCAECYHKIKRRENEPTTKGQNTL